MDLTILQSKILSVLGLGIGTIFVGLLPAWFASQGRQQWPLLLSTLLCFGGGVLFSTSVVHILPELKEAMPEYGNYAEIIFCCGFFILYLIDEMVHYFYGEGHETKLISHQHTSGHSHQNQERRHSVLNSYTYGTTERDPLLTGDRQRPYNPAFYRAKSESYLLYDGNTPPSQLCHGPHQEPCQSVPTVNFGLIIALTVHAMLEGLVVGLEVLPNKVLLLFGAIASHKLVVGFVLGVELASNSSSNFCKHFTCILIFAVGSIAGILLGMVIINIPSSITNLVIPVLQGLAGGTLLYVTVSEILPRERARWHQRDNQKSAGVCQFSSFILGFVLMTVMSKYLDHDG